MALFSAYKKSSILKAAIEQTKKARANEGAKADQLFISAGQGFSEVIKDNLLIADALYHWGVALLHQAKKKTGSDAITLYQAAISKFTFCLLISANYLGAAIDGGVTYMDLARILKVDVDDELYNQAKEFFDNAERIQQGSAAYNLACIAGLRRQNETCLAALETAKKYGSLPEEDEIINDSDLEKIMDSPWFIDFMAMLAVEPEPEIVDKNKITYDVEGNIVRPKKKKQYENEVDGIVYDAEGNILRIIEAKENLEANENSNRK